MGVSNFVISDTTYYLNIESYDETISTINSEKATIVDPTDYDAPNTILYSNGNNRHVFTIQGSTTTSYRSTIISALQNNTKVYPIIYPDGISNVITSNAWYYITELSGYYKNLDSMWYFNITLKYGGV